jgi:GT2 family glycosyltransferase
VSGPPVAVAISTAGRADDLERCLSSLLDGTLRPHEVVVVDQSSGDDVATVVDRSREAGLEVVRHAQAATGLGTAQNAAVAACSCELVAVLDDDCVADPQWLASVAGALASHDVVTGPVLALPPEGDRVVPVSTRTSRERRTFTRRDLPWDVGSGNNFALRREWFLRIGGCDERLGPGSPGRGGVDMDLFHRLLRAGARIVDEPDAVVLHARATPESRRARRVPYGFGIGACCLLWLRQGDRAGARVLVRWLGYRLMLLARALARGRVTGVREELLILAGTFRGLVYGARA